MQLIQEMNFETNFFFQVQLYVAFSFSKLSTLLKDYNNNVTQSLEVSLCAWFKFEKTLRALKILNYQG